MIYGVCQNDNLFFSITVIIAEKVRTLTREQSKSMETFHDIRSSIQQKVSMLTDIKDVKVENEAELCQFSFLFPICNISISNVVECKYQFFQNSSLRLKN